MAIGGLPLSAPSANDSIAGPLEECLRLLLLCELSSSQRRLLVVDSSSLGTVITFLEDSRRQRRVVTRAGEGVRDLIELLDVEADEDLN